MALVSGFAREQRGKTMQRLSGKMGMATMGRELMVAPHLVIDSGKRLMDCRRMKRI